MQCSTNAVLSIQYNLCCIEFTQQDVDSGRLRYVLSATRDQQLERRNTESAALTVSVERLDVSEPLVLPIRYTGTTCPLFYSYYSVHRVLCNFDRALC